MEKRVEVIESCCTPKDPGVSKGKVGYPWESTRDIHQHIPPIYGLYNGCIGQYGPGVILGEF